MLLYSARSWADPGRGQNRSRMSPSLKPSSDWKATATNRKHSNDLEACGKKCCYFWSLSEVKFLTCFGHLFGLSHFALFKCNFYRFLCCKVFNHHLFCEIPCLQEGKCLYKRLKCFKNFHYFFIYLFRWGKGGFAHAYMYMYGNT